MSLIGSELQRSAQRAIALIIRGIGVVIVKVKVHVSGGLGSGSEKWEFVVRGAQVLRWFKEV